MRYSSLLLLLALGAAVCLADSTKPLLLETPALNRTHIVFSYAGDLWRVPREGGEATRLTVGPGVETNPVFSPDGTQIAFQGEYDGNTDVFVAPAEGGVPKRLTYHPGADTPVGWTNDGRNVVFRSRRESYSRFPRLFTVPAQGGFETPLGLPQAEYGSFSPDGKRIAYMPLSPAFQIWKRYRGGETTPIWIATLADYRIEKLPRDNSNDFNPMWVGDKIYFLSDRNGPATLFAYDAGSKKVAQLVQNSGFDMKSASAGPGAIVYEQFGGIGLYDLKSGQARTVGINVTGDIPTLRPAFEKVAKNIANASLSPTGVRAVFEARGEIFTVPADKGDIRNLTNTPGAAEREPAWSPDGKTIAYFSDESGEYELHLRPQTGTGETKKINLGAPAFYYEPVWSPDSKKIAYQDSLRQLWFVDLETKKSTLVDRDVFFTPARGLNPSWAPDSKWVGYTKILKNHLRAVFVYSLADAKPNQVSDGMSDATFARFDKNGKYLYFTASTDTGLTTAWLDMSSDQHPVTRSVYVAVLSKDDASPLAPESDEEKAASKDAAKDGGAKEGPPAKEKPVDVRIDLAGIGQRILALPIPARDYSELQTGKTGVVFLMERVRNPGVAPGQGGGTLHKFELKTRKTDKVLEGVRGFEVSHDGEKMLVRQGEKWTIAGTGAAPKPGEGALKTEAMEARIDPRAEWRQMYREVWRIERDFFYDPGLHGMDWREASKKYEPYLDSVTTRGELNYLFSEMLGELSVGHLFVAGGAQPEIKHVKGGLLGADYAIENGRYRFAKVYNGENWNPELKAPLTQPGVNVSAGEYLLAVNGREVRPPENIYSFFEGTAGQEVLLKVGPNADGSGSREVKAVPVETDFGLRNLAWIEENRRTVDRLSGGRLAYVYMPNTGYFGFVSFNRYFFAQLGKEGAVIDERFNSGGQIADYVIDSLNRPLTNFFMTRTGEPFPTPQNAIFGPKAMIINEYAGSGGDAMPWLFRERHIGPLVGKRTWGGLVGIVGAPQLIDGGGVTAPNLAFYNLKNDWEIENHGVAPDIEVEYDPAAVKAGHDPQLEKAVEVVMEELKKHPTPQYQRPPFPNYHRTEIISSGGAK